MKVFTTNYHISVNKTLIKDLVAAGLEVLLPSEEFAKNRIGFFAPNNEHQGTGATIISYGQFMGTTEPMVILIPCMQLIDDFFELYKLRGERDVIMYLTANSDAYKWYPMTGSDYLMTHDLDFHRISPAKYKILYFSRPTILREKKTHEELRKSFDEKKIKLYINNFDKEGFEPEYQDALKLREQWLKETDYRMPFYGYGMPDGWLSMEETQSEMVDSMFSIVFKRRDTWGQMVNESMLLGTPCVFLQKYLYSTFKGGYLINPDTAIIGETVEQLVTMMKSMTFEQYETLVNEAYSQSQMYCNDEIRVEKLKWLFGKVATDPKMV